MKKTIWVALSLVFAALPVVAENVSDAPDPVVASPDKYRVLLENEFVRVVEYEIGPGEKDNWHSHPAKVSYVVKPGTLQITTAAGESFEAGEEEGTVRWLGAVGKHYGENIGTTPVRILLVEVKGAQDSGNDLNQFVGEKE